MIRYAMFSECGDRPYNEDSVRAEVNGDEACFVLADGLGGHGSGDEASKLVADVVMEHFQQQEISDDFLKRCFEDGQQRLLEQQIRMKKEEQMKTTMVVFIVKGNRMQWAHIGDSRFYVFNGHRYQGRTLDHSVPQMLVSAGQIREKEIRGHADRNRLLKVMGTEWDRPEYQIAEPQEIQGKMGFILCSDGFWELIVEKKMEKCLKKSNTPEIWLDKMKEIVLKNGKGTNMDNFSAIAVMAEP